METNEPKIRLEHIKKVYPNGVTAVKDFSLDIDNGEFVVFVGPSGCGKSTVLRMIAGLEEITDGDFNLDGKRMNDLEPSERNIAMVFQNYALYPHLTVRDNIAFPLTNAKIPFKKFFNLKYRKERKKEIYAKANEVAKIIGLEPYLDRKPKNLSGGQRQRVALGRAIIRNPKVFLLDEPLSNLDAKMRAEMRTEISRLHNDLKTIFIYVTHDQIEAMTMGSKIVVLKDGYIQQIGTPNEIFMNPKNMFVAGFIGTPPMNFFDAKVSEDGKNIETCDQSFKLPDNVFKALDGSYKGKEVVLGVRPKMIKVDSGKLKGKVSISEQLGDEALIYFNIEGDKEYVASINTFKKYEMGEEINIDLDLSYMSLFDKESQESIL